MFQKCVWTKAGYKSACKECRVKEREKDYGAHRAKRLKAGASWRHRNHDRMQALRRAWASANRDRLNNAIKDWERRNPDAKRTYTRNYRARKRSAGGTHSKADITFLKAMQRNRCAVCREALGKSFHVDHIIALVNGGENGRRNLQLLCGACNWRKNRKDPIRFMQENGYLL